MKTEYYEVHGLTAEQIREDMNQHHRRTEGFENHDANAVCDINWRSGRSIIVMLDVTFQIPKWVDYPKGSKELQEEWQRFERNTQVHEEGHRKIAEECARVVERRIIAEGPISTGKLDSDVNNILADYTRKQIEYDEATDHGKTQGAFFNG